MIEVKNLSKSYGVTHAVQDLSFTVNEGEVVGFLGPNGAGKTTTMKILTAFMPASNGSATIAGHDVFDDPTQVKKNVGYLPESPPVYFEMKVDDYVTFAARLKDVPKSEVKAAVADALQKTGLSHVSGRLIGNLSKGYRQRVGIAQAIVHSPKVIILDEPTVGLDPRQIIEIRELIRGLAKKHTVLLSTHILPEVTATCDRVIIINEGKIVAQDRVDNLVGGSKFNLIVRDKSTTGIKAIEAIDGVAAVTETGEKLLIELSKETKDIREQVVATAVENKMGVLEFSSGKLSLEDVFLKFTAGDVATTSESSEGTNDE